MVVGGDARVVGDMQELLTVLVISLIGRVGQDKDCAG
jgi:hypothetical protein